MKGKKIFGPVQNVLGLIKGQGIIVKFIYFLCRYWCSTKVDDQLEHVGGQGNWGFCRQSCPPIALVTTTTPKPTTTTASEVSEAANRGDLLKLHYDFKLVHF